MRVPVYDHYQGRTGAIYSPMTGVYDSLAPTAAQAAYGGLTALQPSQHILQPTYANLLATGPEYYSSYDANDYYSRMRPLQTMHTNETTQELIDRLNNIPPEAYGHLSSGGGTFYRLNRQTQPTAAGSIFTKTMSVEMPSPVDSGIGPELMITPKQELHENAVN